MRYFLYTILILLLSPVAWCQKYQVRNYNAESGLTGACIYRIYRDHRGFMWFCSDYGISRFDGKKFQNILSATDGYLPGSVMSLTEDDKGRMYVSTLKGIVVISDSGTAGAGRRIFNGSTIYAFPLQGKVWIIAKEINQALIELDGGKVIRHDIKDATGSLISFNKIFTGQKGKVIVTSTNGLYTIVHDEVHPFLPEIVQGNVVDIQKGTDGSLWIALKNKVLQIHDGKLVNTFPIAHDRLINNILCDHNNNIWVSIYGESMCLILQNKMVDISGHLGFKKALINDIAEDPEGNVWIATYENGVYEISSTDVMDCTGSGEQSTFYCRSLCAVNDSTILIASIGRVYSYTNGVVKPFKVNSLMPGEFTYFIRRYDNDIYIGTPYKVIKKSILPPYREEPLKFDRRSGAVSIYRDSLNNFFIGGFANLFKSSVDIFTADTSDPLITGKRFAAVIKDSRGWLWLGTETGLICCNGKECKIVIDSSIKGLKHINAIIEDDHGRIWAATHAGLACIDGEKHTVYKTTEGLNSNIVNTLGKDHHNIWIGTSAGLNFINEHTLEIRSYSTGINKNEVLALFYDGRHTLFAGTPTKMLSIDVDKIEQDNDPPRVYITAARTTAAKLNYPDHVYLKYNDNKVVIDFAGLCFKNPESVEYRYKVQHTDENWRTTDNTSVELASLPPGDNVFVLNARKNKGKWSNDVVLTITVATPFWLTWWFITGVSLLVLLVIYSVARRITLKKEYKKHEQLLIYNKITYLKQQALSALINPHFIFNCMNSIQHFLNNHDNDKANNYLADFAQLIRLTLENVQDAYIDLEKELSRIRLYLSLEQLRFGDDLSYDIQLDERIDMHIARIPNMIIQPFIENAIWHGIMPNDGKGKISISFSLLSANELSIKIADNGIGINSSKKQKKAAENQHLGIKLIADRLLLLGRLSGAKYLLIINELNDNSSNTGTLVEIIVPYVPDTNIGEYEGLKD